MNITLFNFTVTDERKKQVDFALPYMKVSLGVISPKTGLNTDVKQLEGKTLIVIKGTTSETYLEKNHPEGKLKNTTNIAIPIKPFLTDVEMPFQLTILKS